MDLLKLAQFLSSRLCHEISGPVSNIANCFELIDSDEKIIKDEARKFVKINIEKLIHRINFYRYAYGFLEDHSSINMEEIELLSNQLLNSEVKLQFVRHKALYAEVNFVKIIMCLIALGEMNAVRGGVIVVDFKQVDNYPSAKINITGKNLKLKDIKMNILSRNERINNATMNIYTAHAYYIRRLCETSKYQILTTYSEDQIEYDLQRI